MTGIISSLPPLIEQPPGNASSNPAGLPGVTYTIALLGLAQTWTAKQTFPLGMITLNAADLTGTLPSGVISPPTPITLGGIFSKTAVTSKWLNSIGTDGTPTSTQPAFTDISGSVAAAQMPALTGDVTSVGVATTIGANKVTRAMNAQGVARSVVGVPGNATANVADIQGAASQFLVVNSAGTALAFQTMTGDMTLSGPASTIAANAITNAKMATMAAFTFKGNNTSGSAVPTDVDIAALTTKATPAAGDFAIISDQAASGAWKKATVSSLAAASSVSSIAGNTGAFTLSTGITNVANDIRLSVPVSVANGGTGYTGVAWTTYTPTITAETGTFTSTTASGSYLQIGKLVNFTVLITTTTVGTAATGVVMTLPVGSALRNAAFSGQEVQNTGKGLTSFTGPASATAAIRFYDATFPGASGNRLIITGIYEAS